MRVAMSRVPTTTSTILLTFLALTTAASSMASRSAEPRADVVFREAASEPPTGALADPLVFSAARRDSTEMVIQSQRATTGRNARLAPVSEAPSSRSRSRSRATRGLNSDPEMSISAPTVESGARDPAQGSGVDAAIRDRYDRDGDTIADMFDNCLEDGNREQTDSDRDGYGNLCDGDYDGDGVVGPADFDVFESAYGKHAGESGFLEIADADGDGVIGVADAVAFRSQFSRGVPGPGAPTFTLAEPGTFHEEWREGNVTLAYSNQESECVGGQAHHRIELSAVNHGQETVEILLTLRSADPDLRFKTARAGLTDETHVYLGAADPGSTPDDKPTFEVVHDCSRGFDFELVKWIPLVTIANQDPSIRILTWNIAFIPDSKNVAEATWEDDEARAKFVVNKLLKEGHGQLDADIIVINEAFNEEAKDALSDGLCGPYPSFVRQLDGTFIGQDSGLMLFSRHPFMGLNFADKEYYAPTAASGWHASEAFTGCPDKIGISDKKFFHQVGFIEYPLVTELAQAAVGCGGLDCLADKGVGAVRVKHKTTEEPINLIFTHMQANDDGIDRVVRAKQFDIMEELIDAIPKWEEQRSFVMGDFNVKGKGCSGGSCSLPEHPGDEWMKHFAGKDKDKDKDKGIFHGGMLKDGGDGSHFTESWGYEMPSEDLGRTHTGHQGTLFPDYTYGHRYDYILHNIPQQRWSCLQHMRVLRHWSDAKGTQASDHLPVWAEFNYWAPHCNPLEAKPAQPAEGQSDFQHAGKIQYGQSVQWLRIDEAGTYSLSASDTVNLEVYEATDMSYPIGPYHGEKSRYGDVYRLDAPPYYIKVKAKSPHFTGGYDFKLHQHACGKGDACELTPGDPDGTWANWQKGVVNSPSRWFGFYTDKGETGTYPAISFAQEAACSENLRMNLWTARMQNGHLVPDKEFGKGWETYESCDNDQACGDGVLHNDQKVTAHDLEPGKYFIEVDGGQSAPGLCATKLNFFTTLTYLWFDAPEGEDNASLTCHDETGDSGTLEEWGEDEISTHLIVDDDANCEASSDKNDYKFFSNFEEDDSPNKGLAVLGNHIYTNCFSLNLMEKDSSSEFYLGPKKPEFFLEVNVKKEVQKRHWGQKDVNLHDPIDGYDYFYYMTYQLSHEDLSKSEEDY